MTDLGYYLVLPPLASHVAALMEGRGVDAPLLSVAELAAGYEFLHEDLIRVKRNEKIDSDIAAREWMVRHVLQRLYPRKAIVTEGDPIEKAGFVNGHNFDTIKFDGRKLGRIIEDAKPHLPGLVNLYDPITSTHIGKESREAGEIRRKDNREPDQELITSLRNNGWDRLLAGPIVTDERGVVLAGRRRQRAIEILRAEGIEIKPDIKPVDFSDLSDDQAALERVRIAAMSNIGKPLGKAERQELIEVLLLDKDGNLPIDKETDKQVSQENIAKAIGVSQWTISTDLRDMENDGRIIGTYNPSKPGPKRKGDKATKDTAGAHADNPDVAVPIADAIEAGVTPQSVEGKQLAEELGIPQQTYRETRQRIIGRKEGAQPVKPEPVADELAGHEHHWVCVECGLEK